MTSRSFKLYVTIIFCICGGGLFAQAGPVHIQVNSEGYALAFANVELHSSAGGWSRIAASDSKGLATFESLKEGQYTVLASFAGMAPLEETFQLSATAASQTITLDLLPDPLLLQQVVVTGTRTFQNKSDAPVMVGVIDAQLLENTQSCSVSEGLKFQPGLRVETDCQTCNYTQLRMNGLGGGYSQILINGRPIFSALTGLYGLEQMPTNLVDRIEVVRGGGSALYGSSAIGGTVNIITHIPDHSFLEVNTFGQAIGEQAFEGNFNFNGGSVRDDGKAGINLMFSNRNRQAYDHNGDAFSELPELAANSVGLGFFIKPSTHSKLEVSLAAWNEKRYGGDLSTRLAHEAAQCESRDQTNVLGSIDFHVNSGNGRRSFIAYAGAQNTLRDHFTGVQPDDSLALVAYHKAPPYGNSKSQTAQFGLQLNQNISKSARPHVITLGTEAALDDVFDQIQAYSYLIDQRTETGAVFAQSNWNFADKWTLLSGLRNDWHNLVDGPVLSPRGALMYKPSELTQFRLSVGRGFRAPQAFDADMHIAFAGGGVSRIALADDLQPERAISYSLSYNADWVRSDRIAGVTLEAFHTHLQNAFLLQENGQDAFGMRFEKNNGSGATVQGITAELRANIRRKMQLQGGFTVQSSTFEEAVVTIESQPGRTNFLRSPDHYGFANLLFTPSERFTGTLGLVYTGSMEVAHFAGAPEQLEDVYLITDPFWEWNARVAYDLRSGAEAPFNLQVYAGVKNMTNAYQNDFDSGKTRDSNYVYGPSLPRTLFVGLKWGLD